MNFVSILTNGLKIAPPEAPRTGHMLIYTSGKRSSDWAWTIERENNIIINSLHCMDKLNADQK